MAKDKQTVTLDFSVHAEQMEEITTTLDSLRERVERLEKLQAQPKTSDSVGASKTALPMPRYYMPVEVSFDGHKYTGLLESYRYGKDVGVGHIELRLSNLVELS